MPETVKRAVISVATGQRYISGLNRLQQTLQEIGGSPFDLIGWRDCWPIDSPAHSDVAYGFKIYAFESAGRTHDTLLWCDSSIVPVTPLDRLWELIEDQGYWLSQNYNHMTGAFCSDAALPLLGISREEAFEIPQIIATSMGLSMRSPIAKEFIAEWKRLSLNGSFNGPHWGGSTDTRVIGHRHDQTAASVVAWRLGMTLTQPPAWIAEECEPVSDDTVLAIRRVR